MGVFLRKTRAWLLILTGVFLLWTISELRDDPFEDEVGGGGGGIFGFVGTMAAKRTILHIGGIFPITGTGGWQGGQACKPAAMLALDDVNNRKDLLPGYVLKMHWNDSECEPGLGAAVMYDLLYKYPHKLMLLAGCSTVCTTVSEAAKMWNLIVLCYGASSPALSDRKRFPTLFRTHPSATVHNPTRIMLMKKYKWSRIAILQQAEEVFISTVEDLELRCKNASIEIVTRQSFLTDPTEAVRNLKRQDARIVVGLFYVVAARRVLCEIYKQKIYGKSYVWFFIGWYEDEWFESNLEAEGINCTKEEMRAAAEGHLTTEALMWNQDEDQTTTSGMTARGFRRKLNAILQKEGYDIDGGRYPEGYQEAPLAYDAVWALSLAFNKTIESVSKLQVPRRLEDFNYTNKGIAEHIYAAMDDTEFLGVSGRVAFSSEGDRIALTQIEQLINGKYEKLGYYDIDFNNLKWENRDKWPNLKVPPDRTVIIPTLRTVSLSLFISMSVVAFVGIIWAVSLIIFNYVYKDRKIIQLSHPITNTLMLIGTIVSFFAVFLVGLDGQFVSQENFYLMCSLRKWVLSIGFTLTYGALFSKVWRVHRLTTKHKSETKHKIQPWKLYLLVATLVGIDILFLSIWTLIDPLERTIEKFPLELPKDSEDDVKILPQLEHCVSKYNNIWLGLTYGFKGVLLIFGLFLAYETRSLKVRHINDSRLVAMSIYNVAVLCLITTPVTMVISSQQDASFAFVGLAIILSCLITIGLVFTPKIVDIIHEGSLEKSDNSNAPDAGTTKEEEEKFKNLETENKELKKLLLEKENRLSTLKERIKTIKKVSLTTCENIAKSGESEGKVSLIGEQQKNNNEDIQVIESYYVEPSESGICQGQERSRSSHQKSEELSESYL